MTVDNASLLKGKVFAMSYTFLGASPGKTFQTDSSGNGTTTRIIAYRLEGSDYNNPLAVLGDANIPSSGTAHPYNARLKATGVTNFNIEAGGAVCQVEVEYSTLGTSAIHF